MIIKGTLSTNQLKSAIEKKLSKEYKSQLSSTSSLNRPDMNSITSKTPNSKSNDLKPKNVKVTVDFKKTELLTLYP